jgi:hypothetical protein
MWLCEAKPQESVVKIGQRLKGRLGIEEKVRKLPAILFVVIT